MTNNVEFEVPSILIPSLDGKRVGYDINVEAKFEVVEKREDGVYVQLSQLFVDDTKSSDNDRRIY